MILTTYSDGTQLAANYSGFAQLAALTNSHATSFTYDVKGRVVQHQLDGVVESDFNARGQRTKMTTAAVTGYEYNSLGSVLDRRLI